jgi:hypothetical protein
LFFLVGAFAQVEVRRLSASSSQVTGITGMHHHTRFSSWFSVLHDGAMQWEYGTPEMSRFRRKKVNACYRCGSLEYIRENDWHMICMAASVAQGISRLEMEAQGVLCEQSCRRQNEFHPYLPHWASHHCAVTNLNNHVEWPRIWFL